MTKDEKLLVDEIRAQIDSLTRRLALFVEVEARLIKEIYQLREENKMLNAHLRVNGQCYFLQSGKILPFKWRG